MSALEVKKQFHKTRALMMDLEKKKDPISKLGFGPLPPFWPIC
jgi:hypothetical protein